MSAPLIRGWRVIGDDLSVRFDSSGAATTAILTVDGEGRSVARQLVGLRQPFVIEYLSDLGFWPQYSDQELRLGRGVDAAIRDVGLCVETVRQLTGRFLLSIIRRSDRRMACPKRLFLAVYDPASDRTAYTDVADEAAIQSFQKVMSGTTSLSSPGL